ncbi:MAG: hypothetical protein CVV24_04125 [Ignavibacteriae bacterium HGW-Ignavibacteriae-3]|nr:MAG: hypothetical protein CVV24_04125 [Ignavibacteriae bacterium HGW-Ignavibacteriae-3]
MKILLIGHSVIDHFEGAGAGTPEPGGIYYSTLGMLACANPEDSISLLTGWNKGTINLFDSFYSRVEMRFAEAIDQLPEVFLNISGEGERKERYVNLSEGLSISRVTDWNLFDGILINMITGFDITADQLKTIRSSFKGTIYLDVHTLSRGVDANMKREFRPIPRVKEWLSNIDILQCNENELITIVQNKNERESAAEILNQGVKIVLVTRGEKGASLYYKSNSELSFYTLDAVKINAVNKVGCGDIFGAVFFYSYISTGDLCKSLVKANNAGALTASANKLTLKTLISIND